MIFHFCPRALWDAAAERGAYYGRPNDLEDGFIHCSTQAQVRESVSKHAKGQADLVLVALDPERLGDSLRWEPARKGELFPHVYGGMPVSAALRIDPLPLGADGRHVFPVWLEDTSETR